ncbi:alanine dehydrogenase [Demequina sp. SYSU T00068]|uniref:alanine dehydrogenase n=1 Tax=Demequina lignilytica TaxID=3051663 RepID=UPI00260DB784|nr:alanine dehydrogenase [Demequina sp. SYSU T00068]MDN4490883.1 alanine dehydrogenase [Demequina sp. SYSU T00068]
MRIGVPQEIKNNENRVAITPAGVRELVAAGHEVLVQAGAGLGSAFTDAEYVAAGASMVSVDEAWGAEMVLKVKEPIAAEYGYLREDLLLFTYLHLAADEALTRALVEAGTTAIAYETVELADGSLPLLAPMSEVAGRMATMVGAFSLQSSQGGRGVLLGGVPGVRPAKVTVLGAGMSGQNAIAQAVGMGADVTVLDLSVPRLRHLDALYAGRVKTVVSSAYEVEQACLEADLVIGAVLVAGAKAPKLVSRELVSRMKPGSVLVDIAIDQGGCFEDSRATTHAEPTFSVEGSTFYCVANMPGAVGNTSTLALTNVTLPYAVRLANDGWEVATAKDPALARGIATVGGSIVHGPVASVFPQLPAAV